MKLYHLPGNVQRIIGGIQIQFIVDDFATFWQRVEKGVFTGCTISPILFVMGIGILPVINSGIYQSPIRNFMDDLTVTTSTHIYKQDGSFQRWKIAFPWRVWIKFKPKMSCIKGRVSRPGWMQIQGKEIFSTVGNPIKCFGKWFNESITDKDSTEYTTKMFQTWLKIVDSSELPEKHTHNAWIYQQGIPSRLMWLLYIYEVATNTVEYGLEFLHHSHWRVSTATQPN